MFIKFRKSTFVLSLFVMELVLAQNHEKSEVQKPNGQVEASASLQSKKISIDDEIKHLKEELAGLKSVGILKETPTSKEINQLQEKIRHLNEIKYKPIYRDGNLKFYVFSKGTMTHSQAQKVCEENGMRLPTGHELDLITQTFKFNEGMRHLWLNEKSYVDVWSSSMDSIHGGKVWNFTSSTFRTIRNVKSAHARCVTP